jgi:hypothetical protein
MNDHFCTYFDHRYVAKGLAMWTSLKNRRASAILHVLCLNEASREILTGLRLPDVNLHSLNAIEDTDPELLRARQNRGLIEYYFTLTPCFPLYIFKTHPEVRRLTYLDADLFFFADPQPVLDEIGDNAIGLIEHRFPDELADLAQHGRFNVGWLTFRRDRIALQCLDTWRAQCLDWCYDRLEPRRFAEQKYLDEWPDRYRSVQIIQHRGANVAPWNLDRFELSLKGEELSVGGQPLLFFHAHGFEARSPGRLAELNLKPYRVTETPLVVRFIFEPYQNALVAAITEIAVPLALALLSDQPRNTVRLLETLQASEADRAARLEVIHTMQRQLEASEADRAIRLDVIQTLQNQLKASEADRAARLDVIHTVQNQLDASDGDRAARLAVIQSLQKQLEVSEADRASRLEVIHSLQRQFAASEADGAARLDVIHAMQTQLDVNDADLDRMRTQLGQALSRVDDIELSRSWRWTRPVRWVEDRLKKRDGGA